MLSYSYTEAEMLSEFKYIKTEKGSFTRNCDSNKIVLTFQPHFYEKENELWEDPVIQQKLLENRKKYLGKENLTEKEILRGFRISGIYKGFSHHSSYWIKAFIEKY